ncbi:MAG: hypothetical protein MI802_13145, partial [Desulfobacterales bacterium]|nr:hypothetical protein [Desulfobacterales bacterium]
RAPFQLSLTTADFTIPEQPRFIYALPKPVQEAFEVIRPSGTMRATLLISRNETDGQIDYEGLAKLVDAKCVLEAFPYPLTECRGQISFDRDEVKIRSFSAKTSGDGHALVYGRIWPPGPTANVDLVVTAVNIPFDETLFQAFDPDTRPIFDALFHTESYNHLRQRGHFISSHDFNAMDFRAGRIEDQLLQLADDDPKRAELNEELKTLDRLLKTPAFDLGGLATVNVHVTRTEGEGDRTRAAAEIKIQEANIVYEEFPYPFHITEGIVRTQGTNITVEGFKLEGLAGGTGKIHGTVVERMRDNGEIGFKPEIFVAGYDLAINEMLYDALPAEQAEWMRKLHLTGMLNLAGQVWRDDRG